jgi:hypothetical protein
MFGPFPVKVILEQPSSDQDGLSNHIPFDFSRRADEYEYDSEKCDSINKKVVGLQIRDKTLCGGIEEK